MGIQHMIVNMSYTHTIRKIICILNRIEDKTQIKRSTTEPTMMIIIANTQLGNQQKLQCKIQ